MIESRLFLAVALSARILSNPIANVFQKKLTARGQHPLFINLMNYGLLSAGCLFFIPWNTLGSLDMYFWIYSILGGIAGAFGNGFIIMALETGELSVLGPINAYKSIVGLIIAFLLIGELPNGYGFLGIAMIIAGSYVVMNTGEGFSWSLLREPAIRYRLWGLLLTGTEAVFDKQVILHSGQQIAFISWSIFGLLFSIAFLAFTKVNLRSSRQQLNGKSGLIYLALGMSTLVMILSTNLVFSRMPVSEALSLFQLSMLVSVFFGYKFFREKDILKKTLGALIMIAGSVLMLLLK